MFQRLIFHFLKNIRPVMIGNYKDFKGKKILNTRVGSSSTIIGHKSLILEENIFIGQYNFIEATNGINIGRGCQITNFVSLLTHSSHQAIRLYGDHYSKVKQKKHYYTGSIFIGDFTFIGPHTVVMPNTNIGKGSIVTAYSYVKGEFPDYSIISGNPAKIIGDTRDMDKEALTSNPELQSYYNEWTKR